MKSVRMLSLSAAFAVVLVLWNGCLMGGGGECDTEGVTPVNVSGTAGDGSVTLTWEIPPYDMLDLDAVQTMVLYPALGGTGEQCAGANINHTPEGCVRGCESTSGSQCTVTGLQNGVAYTFTVITTAYPHNLYRCAAEAFVRTEAVAPSPAMLP
jgi:hypothetical protein